MDLRELNTVGQHSRHPWELSRAQFFESLMNKWVSNSDHRALDIGSGDTWLATRLLNRLSFGSELYCVDKSFTPEILGKLKPDSRMRVSIEVPRGKYDLALFLDVVEHVENDQKFLGGLLENHISRDGILIISVPAFQSLFTSHDKWLGHYRRYSPSQGRALVKAMRLTILADGGLFHGLLYARAIAKLVEKLRGEKPPKGIGQWDKSAGVTSMITSGLNADWMLSESLQQFGFKMPGLSWWCVCRKDW